MDALHAHDSARVRGDANRRFALGLMLSVFFASGFAALLYQVVWQRLLAIFSGADVFSVTIIVAAFMGGLGCGNLAGGHLADRVSRERCLVLFAGAELAIALFAAGSKSFYYDFLYGKLGDLALPTPLLALVLFFAVAWPTFFMGVSLPLLARGLSPSLGAAARTVGALYGWNTLGAAAGAFVTTWFLLRRFDFATILWLGAALNLSCAVAVLSLWRLLGRELDEEAAPRTPDLPMALPTANSAPVFGIVGWLGLYALSGAVALSLEIAWFRVLGVMVKSSSFTFGTLLAIYLLGVASGSLVGSRSVARMTQRPAARFLAIQAWIGIYAALSLSVFIFAVDRLPLLDSLWGYFDAPQPLALATALAELGAHPLGFLSSPAPEARVAHLFVWLYLLIPCALIGPPTFLMGLSFPYLQKAVHTDALFLGRRVGWLQTANIAGSLAGSVLTGFVLLPAFGTPAVFRLLAALASVYVILWWYHEPRAAWPRRLIATAASVVLAVLAMPRAEVFWSKLHASLPDQVVLAEDASGLSLIRPARGRRGHVVLAGGLELSLIPFGAYEGSHTLLGALPLLLHPHPKRVGVIGLGSGDTSYAAGGHPEVEEIETIEIVGSQLDVLRAFQREHADPGVRLLLTDPRFRFVIGDGRTHVRRDRRKYDVIEADALRPTSAYAGNLYSLEYFSLLRRSLRRGGLAVTWIPTPRVEDTFVRAFPYVLLLSEIGIGSETPIRFDRKALLERCDDPWVRSYYQDVGIDLRRIVEERLAARTPRQIGPDRDRSVYTDVNMDLFAKDEFLYDGRN